MKLFGKTYLLALLTAGLLSLAYGCQREEPACPDVLVSEALSGRAMVEHSVTVGLESAETKVALAQGEGKIELSWNAQEVLGVYVKGTDGTVSRAGSIYSEGTEGGRGSRSFKGTVAARKEGESYMYMHPDIEGSSSIDFMHQSAPLYSVEHLRPLLPIVWEEGNTSPSVQGYVIRLIMQFKENPGRIRSIKVMTMKRGADGQTKDRIFAKSFSTANMARNVNNGLAAAKTEGTSAPEASLSDTLMLTVTGGECRQNDQGLWEAEAYLACAGVENLNIFNSKYHIVVESDNGTFLKMNSYKSFAGQQSTTADAGLPMLQDGSEYTLTAKYSNGVCATEVNEQYKVNSLLGMWNTYGKPFDPQGMMFEPGDAALPEQLNTVIGNSEKQAKMKNVMLLDKASQGTPTFTWKMVTAQVSGSGSGYKQADVTYNNIYIKEPTEVYVTFVSEYAWSQNLLGYYHYSGEAPETPGQVLKTFIFSNVSKGGHVPYNLNGTDGGANVNPNDNKNNVGTASDAPLKEFQTAKLLYYSQDGFVSTVFPAGTTIGFMIMRDPKASNGTSDDGESGAGTEGNINYSEYQPRRDNTLLDWNSWRLFTNTKWNSAMNWNNTAYNNAGWWESMTCQNFFTSADMGNSGVIPGLALYGAKDDASHNYNYSFSAMIFMVSTSVPSAMQTFNKVYFNLDATASGDIIKNK